MNRIDRLQAIIIQIQSKKVVKAQEIADRFDISLRTVYRDIRALEEAGVPIGSEAGIGYFLDENYSLPPVMFTSGEALSLLLAGKLMPHLSDNKVKHAFQDALLKIKAILKTTEKDQLEKLEQAIHVYTGMTQPPDRETIFLQEVQKALIHKNVIRITYYSHYKKQENQRDIEPISLLFYAMNWHLVAWCRLRGEYRDFRLDRIRNVEIYAEKFDRIQDKAYEEYLEKEKQAHQNYHISLLVPAKLAHYIHESKYWYGFTMEKPEEPNIEMQFINPDLDGFARWVITMGAEVEIINPPELSEKVKIMVKELCQKYAAK